jgi:hypothetical protein
VFKGTLVTFARDMPSFATYFVVYDIMRHKFKESRIDLGPVGITIVSGATAGIAGKKINITMYRVCHSETSETKWL